MQAKKDLGKEPVEEIFDGYGPKTLVSGWNYSAESFPKDRIDDEYDQRLSSYLRLGVLNIPTPPSTVKDAQETTLVLKSNLDNSKKTMAKKMPYEHYDETAGKGQCELMLPLQLDSCKSTYQSSYVNYFEGPMSCPPIKIDLHEIEKRYRKRLTDPYDIKRSNLGTFLDDNLEYLAECRKSDGAPPPFGLDYEPIWTWDLPKAKQSLESVHSG